LEIAIKVESVCKEFNTRDNDSIFSKLTGSNQEGKIQVLRDISFEVKKGEMFGIIGKNGIGKTTLLRLIAGIYRPDSGKISTNGSMVPLLALGTGFNPELSARDNVIMYGKILGFSHNQIKNMVDKIIEFAELEKFIDVKLKKFSTGMAMRLAFSTAIQVDPDIILVDEILAVGDLGFQKKSYEAFTKFRERKKTIIYVTHDINSINNLCDRAMLLDDGVIKSIGNPSKVINDYLETLDKKVD
jgi:ABC-2 type transport system ATP-binding protein